MQGTSSASFAPIATQTNASSGSATGAFQPATSWQSAPMILLPANHNVSTLLAASSKILPGSTGVTPSFAGPNNFTGFIDLSAPQYVPVNADDDNKSVVTNGIPAKRDFSVAPLPINDPELLPGSVTLNDLSGGAWAMAINYSGNGRIALWGRRNEVNLL
jgi:hypothetical protein